jgi:hypothetical protein
LTGQTRHRQGGGGCLQQALVFDAKWEYMTKMVSSTREEGGGREGKEMRSKAKKMC